MNNDDVKAAIEGANGSSITRRRFAALAAGTATLALAGSHGACAQPAAVLKIGHIQPLTGPSAAYGIRARDGAIMAVDDFALGFAGVALVTYMSSLTSLGYTATQYALLSSAYVYLGKILKGTSGALVDYLSHHGHTLMGAYGIFFIGAGAIGLPGLILCIVLARVQKSGLHPAEKGALPLN